MFHTKICGVRIASDVESVADAGGDAIGLNFFGPSIRFIDPESPDTRQLSDLAASVNLRRIGVFVNEPATRIAEITEIVGLDAIQLHGDEGLEWADQLEGLVSLPLIRAIKLPTGPIDAAALTKATSGWIEKGCQLLFDADAGAAHGGSGKTLHWPSIHSWSQANHNFAWILAGGLNPENVAQAIESTGATSVDTASGVEEQRGVKSEPLIRKFIAASRSAGLPI